VTDLDVIAPATTQAKFKGQPVDIMPLKVGQLPAFARALKPISGSIEAMFNGTGFDLVAFMGLIAENGENVVQAVSIASGVPVEQLNDATPDELIELAAVVLKVNADFFKGRLTPAILAAVNTAKAAAPTAGAGQTP
jgi:hypothetical protein